MSTLPAHVPLAIFHRSRSRLLALYQSRSLVPSWLKSRAAIGSQPAGCPPMSMLAAQWTCGPVGAGGFVTGGLVTGGFVTGGLVTGGLEADHVMVWSSKASCSTLVSVSVPSGPTTRTLFADSVVSA